MDIAEFEQRFRDLFGKGVAEVRADLAKADEFATAHAPALEKVLGSVVGALRVLDPQVGGVVSGAVTTAESAFGELQALYTRYFG